MHGKIFVIFVMIMSVVILFSSCGVNGYDFFSEEDIFEDSNEECQTEIVTQTETEISTYRETEIITSTNTKNLLSSDGGENIIENENTIVPVFSYSQSYYAMNFENMYGIWISYLEYENIMKNFTETEFTENIEKCFDNVKSMGMNTVFVQARAFGDSYYDSKYFPKGTLLSSDYDPLEIMVKTAHERGLSVHAWINPMRLQRESEFEDISGNFSTKEWYDKGINTFVYDERVYLDVSSEDARGLICDGVKEIIENYDVDGIQIDDYFYPSQGFSLDEESYENSGKALSHADFRRENVSMTVKMIYETVHNENETVLFGISPSGNIENNEDVLFADVKKWCSESGYCDYICPQIYYGFEHETHPFEETVSEWENLCSDNMKLAVGIAAYKCGEVDEYAGSGKNEWIENKDVLSRQIKFLKQRNLSILVFRYDSVFNS